MVSLSEQQQKQQRTLGFLKPDVTGRKSELMTLIKSNELWKVTFEQELILSSGEAKALYPQGDDATWLSSHPIYVFILEGPDVVKNWKEYVGPQDPEEAKQVSPQSLRATFGLDSLHNVCHASDSDKQAHHDLIWLQGLVLDDLSISSPPPDVDHDKNTTSASSSEKSNKSVKSTTATKPSKLKKPTTSRIGKAAPSKSAASTSSNNSSSSSSSESKKKVPATTTKQSSIALPRPKSSLGTRPATPNSTKTTPKSPPPTTGRTQKIPTSTAVKKSIPTATSAKSVTPAKSIKPSTPSSGATRSGPLRTSKAQASNGRKEMKSSRISSRSELSNKSSPDSVATMGPSTSKRLSNTGGISKNTPGISVLTGRTRKQSRLEKRKDTNDTTTTATATLTTTTTTNTTSATPPITADDDSCNQQTEPSNDNKASASDNETAIPIVDNDYAENRTNGVIENDSVDDIPENNNHAPYATESVNTLTSASTSYSQRTMESDHDAEVAAATSAALPAAAATTTKITTTTTTTNDNNNNNNITSTRIDSPNDLMDRRRSSSFSPASVASSLARPETPEVDNLRQRFESLTTTTKNTTTTTATATTNSPTRRTSSITPEMALRIKDLKPKDPAGSRVKSMVEFFMDENIHKWEF
ncbi:unnamed protein product [Absidia cylindrospora]